MNLGPSVLDLSGGKASPEVLIHILLLCIISDINSPQKDSMLSHADIYPSIYMYK